MKRKSLIITTFLVIIFSVISLSTQAGMYSRRQARNTIEQTSYIINQAYEIAYYYSYWQTNNVSRAMYYNNYAQDLYFYGNYRNAIRYSLLAREYALDVIDNCDDYWEFFYYTYFGWSARYGYNYEFAYYSGYMDGYYDGYYARYCARHSHDYRRDPHQNLHSSWYKDNVYNEVVNSNYGNRNSSSVALGRGETGRTGFSSTTGSNSSIGRNTYNNITTDNYFSQKEISILKDTPSKTILENDFKKNNPKITFSDANLSDNAEVIKRNSANASAFTTKNSNTGGISRVITAKPSSITLKDGVKITGRSSEIKDIKLNIDREFDATRVNRTMERHNTNTTPTSSRTNFTNRSINNTRQNNNNTNRQIATPDNNSNLNNRSNDFNNHNSNINNRNNNINNRSNNINRSFNTSQPASPKRTTTINRNARSNNNTENNNREKLNSTIKRSDTPSRNFPSRTINTEPQKQGTLQRNISR
ncbi:MAG: hypothetical protein ACTTJH_03015 [Bacteroidales bacterium]